MVGGPREVGELARTEINVSSEPSAPCECRSSMGGDTHTFPVYGRVRRIILTFVDAEPEARILVRNRNTANYLVYNPTVRVASYDINPS